MVYLDAWQFTPIHRACSQGHGNVVMELLKSRAPRHVPSEEGKEMILSEGESSSAFGELVSNSSISRSSSGDSSSWGGSTLWGSKLGGSGTGGAALPPGVIDLRNHFLATPLHRAAAKGHAQVGGTGGGRSRKGETRDHPIRAWLCVFPSGLCLLSCRVLTGP